MNRTDARILVVEDSPSMRVCLCYLLRQLGFQQVDEAVDGGVALTMFEQTAYDLVITDWYMPHLDGLELLRAIRCGPMRDRTPVLVLTGSVSHGHLHEAVEAGATGFIPKPFFNPALSDQVTSLVAAIPTVSLYEEDFEDCEAPETFHASA